MKKVILAVLLTAVMASAAGAADMKGKLGFGVNWPGIQVRYGVTNNILAEGRFQFSATGAMPVGGRAYYLFPEIKGSMPIMPYAGIEYDWVLFPGILNGGYLAGAFGGAELMLNKNISVGGDVTYCYVDVWYNQHVWDTGILFNFGLTYYFN